MPRDLFGDVSDPSVRVRRRSHYTLPVSLAAHALVVAVLVAIPIVAPAVLPSLPISRIVLVTASDVPPPPPPPAPASSPVPPAANPNAAPIEPPPAIVPEPERPQDFAPPTADRVVPGTLGSIDTVIPDQPPPPAPQAPVRVGDRVRAPAKVREVLPVYPAIAQAARVEGVVILEAIIGVDGRVEQVRVLRSVQLLDQAAVEAVRQWEYTPSMLNGVPVPVIMTVTVSFRLSGGAR